MEENDEVVQEFLVESYENLDRLDQDLVALERAPDDVATLSSIFRTIHTIKGTCGFLGFSRLESVTHVGENLLGKLRDRELSLDEAKVSGLLRMVDAVRAMLASIEATGSEGEGDYTALVEELGLLARGEVPMLGEILVARTDATAEDVAHAVEEQLAGDLRPIGELLVEEGVVQRGEVADALQAQAEARSAVADHSIRVDVALLDKLMNLVGELVLARNRVLQFTRTDSDPGFVSTSQRLNLITSELQEGVMKTRMQPVGNVWSKFPRVVRDLALQCGKQVRIEMEGEDTELDKTIIEAIKDPLTHIVRNSVDHGIETPELRLAAGKPAEGRLFLRAFHEGGQVNIEVTDDGAGIDVEKVRSRAVERNLLTAEQAARMGDHEVANLIFLPGFSTASAVTNISGRGVGMDVVKTSVEKIGGTVDLQPRPGQGTTLRIRIPLTLAIIPALIVVCGEDRYAIPQVNLLELVRLEGEQARTAIEHIHDTKVYRLRGNLLPLVDLRSELRLPERGVQGDDVTNIVVLQADDRQFGLVVEGVTDTEEIVVKPLGRQLKGIATFAGATIMGDGRLALILDVLGLAQQAKVVSEGRERSALATATVSEVASEQTQALVVLRVGADTRVALPLSHVARLEEFPRDLVERGSGQDVVQYRGEIMPLVHVAEALRVEPGERSELLQVVVHRDGGRTVGLVVDEILDIVEEHVVVAQVATRRGLFGSAVVQGRVTDLLDVAALVPEAPLPTLAIGA